MIPGILSSPLTEYPARAEIIKSEFIDIFNKIGKEQAQDACRKWVSEQKTGKDVLIASKIFQENFPSVTGQMTTFEFSDGTLSLSSFQIDALKKDSETIKDLLEEAGESNIPITQISKGQFLSLLNALYPNEAFEKGSSNLMDFILAANYLDMKEVLDSGLKQYAIQAASFKEDGELTKALDFLKSIQKLPYDLRKPIELKMASYFGKVLHNAGPKKEEIIKKFQDAQVSTLSFEELKNVNLKDLSCLPSLKFLDLSRTDLKDDDIQYIPKGITDLNLNYCKKITDNSLPSLPRGLVSLGLRGCKQITHAGFSGLPRELRSLELSGCEQITDAGLLDLPRGLNSLDLFNCKKITDAGLANLPPGLSSLNLGWCEQITEGGLAKLPRGLSSLNLEGCALITDAGLANLPPGLSSLDLGGCKQITDAGLAKLPPGLNSLSLLGCEQITDAGLAKLSRGLSSLNLRRCKQITDGGLANLPRGLSSLNLEGCKQITDAGLANLPPGLSSLDLGVCKKITDAGLAKLSRGLSSLNLLGCEQITDAGLAKLPPGLSSLNLERCKKITENAVNALRQKGIEVQR